MKLKPQPGLIVDLFAGGGGASTALFQVTGRHPDIAINHDADAIGMHAANHPSTRHYQCDIFEVDPVEACTVDGELRPVDILWMSPDCTHHSKARGGKPVEKGKRALADVGLIWVDKVAPRILFLENVEEWQDWGPLMDDGRPDPTQVGLEFRRWVKHLESRGYVVKWKEIVAADFGDPTTRKRLKLIARRDGLPIIWPDRTHASRKELKNGDLFTASLKQWKGAATFIEWERPCPSIFMSTTEAKKLRIKRPLGEKTEARIFKGIKRFCIEKPRPYIVQITNAGWNNGYPRQTIDPLKTITTSKGGEYALSAPSVLPVTHGGGEDRVYDPEDAGHTVTAANRGELAVATPVLVPRYGERVGQEPRDQDGEAPYPVVVPTANGGDLASVFMQKMNQNGVGSDMDDPLYAAMAGAPRHYEVAAYLGRQFGSTVSGTDAEDPAPTVMADGHGGKTGVVAVHLERQFGRSVGSDGVDPMGVVMPGGGGKTQVVGAVLQNNGERIGRPTEDPLTTTTDRGTQQTLMAVNVDKYYGTGVTGSDPVEPLGTTTDRMRFGLNGAFLEQANTDMVGREPPEPLSTIVGKGCTQRLVDVRMEEMGGPEGSRRRAVLEFLWKHAGEPTEQDWANPLRDTLSRLRFGLVLVDDVVYQIVDIGMRMLSPRELFLAQGFPADYIIDRTAPTPEYPEGRPITKTAQTSCAGNSVCPGPARAILRANLESFMDLPERLAA